TFFIGIVLFSGANFIIESLYGESMKESAIVLRIMSFIPMLTAFMNIYGVQVLITFGKSKQFSKVMLTYGVLNIVISAILISFFEYKGTAYGVLITNILIAVNLYFIARNKVFKVQN
ncbi:MAG: hypothetical protein ABF649_22460, partial [Bacillus sp. (in: firmicutes)]